MKELRFTDTMVTFSEVPDEITLCISITGCDIKCKGCHSEHLWEHQGDELTAKAIDEAVTCNKGITCVALMGGDYNPLKIKEIAKYIKDTYKLKVAWYSGSHYLRSSMLSVLDYYKVGPYVEELGGLDSPETNQVMFKIEDSYKLLTINHKFHHGNKSKNI